MTQISSSGNTGGVMFIAQSTMEKNKNPLEERCVVYFEETAVKVLEAL